MIQRAQPREIILASSDPYQAQLDVCCLAKQLGKRAHGPRGVALCGKMPERSAAPRIEASFVRGCHKPCYGLIVSGSEIEGFIEFPGASQFGDARAQTGIVGNLTEVHVMEAGDANGAFLRDLVESLAYFRVRSALRNAQVACRAHCARNAQTEVTVRKEDPSAIFGDERVVVAQLSPDGLDFLAGTRGKQYECDFSPVQFRQGFFGACKGIRAWINDDAFESRKDQMTWGEQEV